MCDVAKIETEGCAELASEVHVCGSHATAELVIEMLAVKVPSC
jgi:hypothetical protein